MGYRELLQALEEEVGRQIRELRAEASQERQRLLDATRQELAGRRETVLEEEGRRVKEQSARALARARMEHERAILAQMRRDLAAIECEATARLKAIDGAGVLTRLLDELVPELGEGPVELRVREADVQALTDHLRREHPALMSRATVQGAARVQGGVEASLDGRQILDNTLPSRLQNAWLLLEPEIVGMLFGGPDGRL